MPRAEAGSTKWVANKMKSKGLQRLRWWCEPCQRQCRDANGFKMHCQSPSHVRQMQIVGEDPRKFINQYSAEFQNNFVSLLRTAHGEKWISSNKHYQDYIRDKEHVHMNATRFASLTEFVKHLGREGIVHVKEDEKEGLMIAWRDVSAAAVQRREEIKAQEEAEARSGAGEDKMLKKMAKRAAEEANAKKELEARRAALLAKNKPEEEEGAAEPAVEDKEEGEKKEGEEKDGSAEAQAQAQAQVDGEGEPPKGEEAAAAPVKLSFGLKAKTAPPNKPGLGQMKSKSIFKRARADGEGKPAKKKVKL